MSRRICKGFIMPTYENVAVNVTKTPNKRSGKSGIKEILESLHISLRLFKNCNK